MRAGHVPDPPTSPGRTRTYAAAVSPSTARALAIPFAVLACVLRATHTLVVVPWTARPDVPPAASMAGVAAFLASAVVPVGCYLLLSWPAQRRRPTWEVDRDTRRFVAPATPYWTSPYSVFLGWLLGGLIVVDDSPHEEIRSMAQDPNMMWATTLGIGAGFLAIVTMALVNRPTLLLDAEAVTVRGLFRTTTIGWDDIAPGQPPPQTRTPGHIKLLCVETSRDGRKGVVRRIPARFLHVDPAFLAGTLRHIAGSADRTWVGTDEGLLQLRARLGAVVF